MARSRFHSLESGRRESILRAAAAEFAARGFAGASLARIIEAAGMSRGSLYYYFADKEDLFVTTLQMATHRLAEAVGVPPLEQLRPETFWDTLLELGIRVMEMRLRNEWFVGLARALPRLREDPNAAAVAGPALQMRRRFTRELLGRGQALGQVRQDLPLDLLVDVTIAVDEAADRWFTDHHELDPEESFRTLAAARIDLMRDMLDARHEGWDR